MVALQHGWKPAGTVDGMDIGVNGEVILRLDGAYCTNDYQLVKDDDAKSLGEALKKSLSKFKGDFKKKLKRFIQFCREVGFEIF